MCALWRMHTSCHLTLQHHHRYHSTESHRQWNAVWPTDDGRKDARNMLRNNWLPINHYLLHLVGLAIFYLSKMHGYSNIKFNSVSYTKPPAASLNFQNCWLLLYGFIMLMEWKYRGRWFSLWTCSRQFLMMQLTHTYTVTHKEHTTLLVSRG